MRTDAIHRWLIVGGGVLGAALVLAELVESPFLSYPGVWWSAMTALAAIAAVVALAVPGVRDRAFARYVPAGVAVASVGVTLGGFVTGKTGGDMTYLEWGDSGIGAWLVVEALALSALVVLAGRHASSRRALLPVVGLALAVAVIPLRTGYVGDSHAFFVALRLCQWSVVMAVGVATLTGYLRAMDRRRAAEVGEARRAQRIGLATDLHDFAAHDVNGMVVQAQAAQLVAERDPQQALAALRRIEQAGLHALASMDRTVAALRAERQPGDALDGTAFAPVAGLAELPALVERFAAAGPTTVELDMAPGVADGLGHEVSSTAYRVVVEALTNVRRHAPAARAVTISVRADHDSTGPSLAVTVVNDTGQPRSRAGSRGERGGHGLNGLVARLDALGGTLRAGPVDGSPRRWRVSAVIPSSRPRP